jgi:prepilin-type N-terminal cleavage/methylation domain-containing protein
MKRRQAHPAGGFTLLEIVVSLAVIGLMLGIVVSRMDTMLEWDMKSASTKLASTIRYLYNKAATEGLYMRLVLDLEEQAYWVEATTDPFTFSAGEEGDRKAKGGD